MRPIKYVVNGHDLPHGFTTKREAIKYFKLLSRGFTKITLKLIGKYLRDRGVYILFIGGGVYAKIETWKRYREGVAIGYNDPVMFAINHEVVES